ncbi:protein arginine methyltransferase NDUFAF7, mitochondrial [Lonchura striata]
MEDILRVFKQLASVLSTCDVSVHLVEVSPKLSEIQAVILTGGKVQPSPEDESAYMKGISKTGIPIFWYRDIQDVPPGHSFYLAHEFFDALPIHKFQRTEKGWCEVLVDIDPEVPDQLLFVLSPSRTPVTQNFIQVFWSLNSSLARRNETMWKCVLRLVSLCRGWPLG